MRGRYTKPVASGTLTKGSDKVMNTPCFDYILVSTDQKVAYMCGSYAQCARYALANGLRATTKIEYWPISSKGKGVK